MWDIYFISFPLQGHTWTATASIYNPSVFVGTLSGTTAQFNASAEDQTAEFTQLTLIKGNHTYYSVT